MKNITIKKIDRVDAPQEDKEKGIVAYQLVEFIIDFFGNKVVSQHDTKIMKDGSQFVYDGGCGFIEDGYRVA